MRDEEELNNHGKKQSGSVDQLVVSSVSKL